MHTIRLDMTKEAYQELQGLATEMGEESVATLVRVGLGLMHFLHRKTEEGKKLLLVDEDTGQTEQLVFPPEKED